MTVVLLTDATPVPAGRTAPPPPQVVNCQRSLMQMEAGGSLATPTWQVSSG